MRRNLTVAFASLLAVLALAPAADGATRVRAFQDLSVTGSSPGRAFFTVVYKNKKRHGKFTPRLVVGYRVQTRVSCKPDGDRAFEMSGAENSKFLTFREKLIKGRFAHRFEDQFESPPFLQGDLAGTVLPRIKRGKRVTRPARIIGAFDVEDWDPDPGNAHNCTGSWSYSATPCKPKGARKLDGLDVPVCREYVRTRPIS